MVTRTYCDRCKSEISNRIESDNIFTLNFQYDVCDTCYEEYSDLVDNWMKEVNNNEQKS